MEDLTMFETIVIAIVEGLTEFPARIVDRTHDYCPKRVGRREYRVCKGIHVHHPVWRHPLGGDTLLETVLPPEPHAGTGRSFVCTGDSSTSMISTGSCWWLSSPRPCWACCAAMPSTPCWRASRSWLSCSLWAACSCCFVTGYSTKEASRRS